MVGLGRLELPTSRLSGVRSNQLIYRPLSYRHKVKLLLLQQLYFANKLIKELTSIDISKLDMRRLQSRNLLVPIAVLSV